MSLHVQDVLLFFGITFGTNIISRRLCLKTHEGDSAGINSGGSFSISKVSEEQEEANG